MENRPITAVVICNGELDDARHTLRLIRRADLVIAADGGTRHLHALRCSPDVIIGDMDSIEPSRSSSFPTAECVRFPVRKDQSDTQLGIELAVNRGAGRVVLAAAFGGRPDHIIGHLSLLARYPGILEIHEHGMVIRFVEAGVTAGIDAGAGMLVSLVPFPAAGKVTTWGLEYPLAGERLDAGTRGISNRVAVAGAWVRVEDGGLLLCSARNLEDGDDRETEI